MGLNPNTKAIIKQREIDFSDPNLDVSKIDPKELRQKLESSFESFAPIRTDINPDDYSGYIQGNIDPIYGDINEARAMAQNDTFGGRALTLSKFVPRAITRAVSEVAKMPGELAGLGEWALTDRTMENFESIVNNQWVQSIDEAQQSVNEELFPVYKRRVVENGGLFRQVMSPEFWATEGADGAGFLVGMMAPGALLKMAGLGETVVGGINALSDGAKLAKAEKGLKLAGQIDDFSAGALNTFFEAASEGIEGSKSTSNELHQKKYNELVGMNIDPETANKMAEEYIKTPEAKAMAGTAGYNTFKANLAILIGPNILDQKWLMKGVGRMAGSAQKAEKGAVSDIISNAFITDGVAKNITKSTTRELTKEGLAKGIVGVFKEGFFEEGMQSTVSNYYKDRAIAKEDPFIGDELSGIVREYFDGLSDIDTQKSIFLGSVMGGVMGGIGARNAKKREDDLIFGSKDGKVPGFKGLFEGNLINRWRSVDDLSERNDDGSQKTANGKPVFNPLKVKAWGASIADKELNRKLLEEYDKEGKLDAAEFAKDINDFNIMMPFFSKNLGKASLNNFIEQLSKAEEQKLKDKGLDPKSAKDIEIELKNKAAKFEEIYYGRIVNHIAPKIKIDKGDKDTFNAFNSMLVDTKMSNVLGQNFAQKKIDEVNNELLKPNLQESDIKNLNSKLDAYKATLTQLKESYKELEDGKLIAEEWDKVIAGKKNIAKEVIKEQVNSATTSEEVAKTANNATKNGHGKTVEESIKEAAATEITLTIGSTTSKKKVTKSQLAPKDEQLAETGKEEIETESKLHLMGNYEGSPNTGFLHVSELKKKIIDSLNSIRKQISKDNTRIIKDIVNKINAKDTEDKDTVVSASELNKLISELYIVDDPIVESTINEVIKSFNAEKQREQLSKADGWEVLNPIIDENPINIVNNEGETESSIDFDRKEENDSVFTGNVMQFKIDKKSKKVDYDESSVFTVDDKDFSHEYNNDPDNLVGTFQVTFEINFDNEYNKKVTSISNGRPVAPDQNKVQVLIVHYDKAGKRHVVSMLGSPATKDVKGLTELREKIINNAIANYKSGVISKSNIISNADKGRGRFKSNKPRSIITKIKEKFLPKGKLIVGYVGYDSERGIYIETPNESGFDKVDVNRAPGSIVLWIKAANGTIVGARGFTKSFSELESTSKPLYDKEFKSIIDIFKSINKDNYKEKLDLVKDYYFHISPVIKKDTDGNPTKIVLLTSKFARALSELPKDKKSPEFKEMFDSIEHDFNLSGKLWGILKGQQIIGKDEYAHITYTMDLAKSDEKFSEDGDSIYSRAFKAFVGDMNHQISKKQINRTTKDKSGKTIDFNKEILPNYLHINFDPEAPFHSPIFNISSNWSEQGEVKKVKKTTKSEDPEDNLLSAEKQAKIRKVEPTVDKNVGKDEVFVEEVKDKTVQSSSPVIPVENVLVIEDENIDAIARGIKKSSKSILGKKKSASPSLINKGQEFELWDKIKEMSWLQRNLPIDTEDGVLKSHISKTILNVDGKMAWGSFGSNLIELYEYAMKGTAYHEGFHAVFQMALNPRERLSIMNEAKERYKTSDERFAEEQMAEAFTKYVISNEQDIEGLGNKIIAFFKRIYAFIKYGLLKNNTIDGLFYRINSGHYKNASFTQADNGIYPSEALNYIEKKQRIADIASTFSNIVDDLRELDGNKNKSRTQLINEYGIITKLVDGEYVDGIAMAAFERIDDLWSESGQRGTKSYIDIQYALMLSGLFKTEVNDQGFVELPNVPQFNDLGLSALREFARVERIKFNMPNGTTIEGIDPLTDEEVVQVDEDNNKLEHWMIKATEQSMRDRVGTEVKSMLARIPIKDKDGNIETNSLGFAQYLDFGEAHATILREVAGCTSFEQMLENLTEFVVFNPTYQGVLDKLNSDKPFRAKFWDAMQNIHMNYTLLKQQSLSQDADLPSESRRKRWIFMSANRQAVTSSVLESWREDINNPHKNYLVGKKTKSNITEKQHLAWLKSEYDLMAGVGNKNGWWGTLVSKIRTNKGELAVSDVKELAKRINDIGIDITSEELVTLSGISAKGNDKNQLNIFLQKIHVVLNLVYTGKDPIVENDPNIKTAAKIISRVRPELMEDSFRDLNNRTNYSHTLMGFLTRFMSDLKRETNGEWNRSKFNSITSAIGYKILPWLSNLENKEDRDNFTYSIFKGISEENQYRGTEYSKMSSRDLNIARLNAFFNNGTVGYANYMVPTLAGSGISMFIRNKRLPLESNDTENTTDAMFFTLRSEWDIVKNSDKLAGIKDFEKRGANFVLFEGIFEGSKITQDQLNEMMTDIDNEIPGYEDIIDQVKELLNNYAERVHQQIIGTFERQGIIEKDEKGEYVSDVIDANVTLEDVNKNKRFSNLEAFIRSYTYNYLVAKPNMLMLFTGTSAAYKNTELVYKRLKQISTPGTRIDVDAVINLNEEQAKREGSNTITVGNSYNIIIINDIEEDTSEEFANAILDIQLKKAKSGEISYAEAYSSAARLGYSNTVIDNKKWAIAKDESGNEIKFTNKKGEAESLKFMSGTNNLTDGSSMIRPKRHRAVKLGVGRFDSEMIDGYLDFMEGKPTQEMNEVFKPFVFGHRVINGMRVPYQIKNAESVYDPRISFMQKDDNVRFAEDEDETNGFESYKYPKLARIAYFMEKFNIDSVHFNSTFKVGEVGTISMDMLNGDISQHVQILENEDYMLIDDVVDHVSDQSGIFGVQIRKLGISDIADEAKFSVDAWNDDISKNDLIDKYHEIIAADVEAAFINTDSKMPKNDLPVKEYNEKMEALSRILIEAMESQNMGQDSIDSVRLYIPANNGGRKQFNVPIFDPIHAGKMSNMIGSMYKNTVIKHHVKGGNLVMVSSFGYSDTLELHRNDNGGIEAIDCYLPWYSQKSFEGLMDENGIVDISKITDPKMLELIAYRIPTEDKYSMLPLRIKGFLPRSVGGIVILPREITTLSGADFDIDKLYLLMRNYSLEYDYNEANKINKAIKSSHKQAVKDGEAPRVYDDINYDITRILGLIRKTGDISSLDVKDRNVYKLYKQGVANGTFSNVFSYATDRFDYNKPALEQSKSARDNAKIDILWSILTNNDTASKLTSPGNFDYYTEIVDEIKVLKGYKKNLDIIHPMTDITMFEAASAASELIGVFANHNIGHAIFQHGNIRLSESIWFDGKEFSSLSEVQGTENIEGEDFLLEPKRVSRKLSMLLSAIVDDLKSLNSGPGNVNFFTVDVLCSMIRAGFSLRTAMSLINQPIVMDLTQKYFEYGGGFEGYKQAYKEILGQYGTNTVLTSNDLSSQLLWDNIGRKDTSDDFMQQQITTVEFFDKLRELSMDIGLGTKVFKSDDTKRKVTLSSNEVFERNVKKAKRISSFSGLNELWDKYKMMKAFHDFGIIETTKSLSELFPFAKPAFMAVKNKIAANLVGKRDLTEEQIDNLNYEILGAMCSEFEFFNGDLYYGDSNVTSREYMLNSFPADFLKTVTKYPELKKFRIIKNLKYVNSKNPTQVDYLKHSNTGKMNEEDIKEIKNDWLNLLYYKDDKDPEKEAIFKKLAENMVKYTYFAYGFHMNAESFSHLIPRTWRSGLSDSNGLLYNDYLDQQLNSLDNNLYLKNLYKQIKQHKYKNSFFVPRLDFDKVEKYITFDENNVITGLKVFDGYSHSDNLKTERGYTDYTTVVKNGKYYFMEQTDIVKNSSGTIIGANYKITNTLGIKDHAQEYSISTIDKASIFPFNNIGGKELTHTNNEFNETDVNKEVEPNNTSESPKNEAKSKPTKVTIKLGRESLSKENVVEGFNNQTDKQTNEEVNKQCNKQ